jgi:hypothetical protein
MDSVLMGTRVASAEELLERLCNDQVRRWRVGQRVPAEAYCALYPAIRDDGEDYPSGFSLAWMARA